VLKHRLIFGPLLIVLFFGAIWLDDWLGMVAVSEGLAWLFPTRETYPPGLVLYVLGMLVAPLAARELTSIVSAQGIRTRGWLTAVAAMIGLTASYTVPVKTDAVTAIAIMATAMILVFVVSLLVFSRHKTVEGVVAAAGAVVFAMVYLGLMFGFFLALRRECSAWWIAGVIIVTKMCDTGAYFTGRAIGRRKLIPWLSPGKTWEGLAGGVLFAMLIGWGLAWLSRAMFTNEADWVPLWIGPIAGFAFGLIGQFGDLTMSLLKRGAGIKDSSTLIPGLGGVLDVLDSPLMVAPVAYWLLTWS
jgi:phosphatidate cytidylyltransferase